MYVQVYSRIIDSNIGNAGGLNTALNQPKRSRLYRHDIIQKKHSIIQQGIKSPPEHCIPTVGAGISRFICCCRLPLAQRAVAEPGHNQKP